ncbi:uncharacterized protein LOC111132152 [Crassostrea virginica]
MDLYWGKWKHLMVDLENVHTEENTLSTAIQWYENEAMSRYGCQPHWNELLTCLLHKEPVIRENNLEFVPVFHHLPQRLQSTLLQLMLHFRHRIPTAELLIFTRELRATIGSAPVDDNDDTWPGVYFRMLSAHCQMCNTVGPSESEDIKDNVLISQTEQLSPFKAPKSQSPCSNLAGEDMDIATSPEVIEILSPTTEESNLKEIKEYGQATEHKEFDLDAATQAKLMKLRECWQMEIMDLPEEFSLFYMSTPDQVADYCRFLDFDSLTESAVICAGQHLLAVSENITHANAVELIQSTLLKKISETVSRPLFSLLKKMAEKIPQPLVDGFFVHLVSKNSSSSQIETICKIIKESMPVKDMVYMIKKLNHTSMELSEGHLSLYQTLVELKIPLENEDLSKMLDTLKKSAAGFSKHLKFGKLVLATLNIYGDQMDREQISTINIILQSHSSFFKKSIKTLVQKLASDKGFC